MSHTRKLRFAKATDGDDIDNHLNKVIQYWVLINSMGYDDINIPVLHSPQIRCLRLERTSSSFVSLTKRVSLTRTLRNEGVHNLIGILKGEHHCRDIENVM